MACWRTARWADAPQRDPRRAHRRYHSRLIPRGAHPGVPVQSEYGGARLGIHVAGRAWASCANRRGTTLAENQRWPLFSTPSSAMRRRTLPAAGCARSLGASSPGARGSRSAPRSFSRTCSMWRTACRPARGRQSMRRSLCVPGCVLRHRGAWAGQPVAALARAARHRRSHGDPPGCYAIGELPLTPAPPRYVRLPTLGHDAPAAYGAMAADRCRRSRGHRLHLRLHREAHSRT